MNFEIKNKKLYFTKPYIIAEIGSNFNQNYNIALKLIRAAKIAGADAVKFQLFNAKKMYPKDKKMFRLFKSIELNKNWVPKLKKYSENIGLDFFASPFDLRNARILKKNKIFAFKIASSELTNYKLINYISKTKKPIFISTGMSDLIDVKKAISICVANKNYKIILMQCGSMYPLPEKFVNLNVLNTYKSNFNYPLGFSDHTKGNLSSTVAVGVGAMVFEKHFTLNKKFRGPDHFFALEPKQFKKYVQSIHRAFLNLGSFKKDLLPDEKKFSRREGLYYKKSLKKGHKIKKLDLLKKRPALGIRSRDINKAIGRRLKQNVNINSPLSFIHFKKN